MAVRFDFTVRSGNTLSLSVPVWDGEGGPILHATLAASWSARAAVRPVDESDVVLQAWSTQAGTITWGLTSAIPPVGPAAEQLQYVTTGAALLAITGDMSAAWDWKVGEYGLDVIDPTGEPTEILLGVIRVEPDAARP